ncbi:MAG: bifunctional [glutamine synthetase] adenylyltransferase/[glutamine synthetase]-adenylyl-L-tyrosine phosphorylase [Frankiaceae bacterium]
MSEHPRGVAAVTRLARLGYADPPAAERRLAALGLLDDAEIEPDLAEAADPDLALRGLENLADAAPDRAQLLGAVAGNPDFRRRLTAVLGASAALGDHLGRHPAEWHLLARPQPVDPGEGWRARRLRDAVQPDLGTPAALDTLRLAYRRQLMGIAAADLTDDVTLDQVGIDLAELAGAALAAALAIAQASLPPGREPCRLAIIGMGKCGGRELNYVSDVDVIFVGAPAEGSNDESAALRTAEVLAAAVMRVCSATTKEGTLWPVDAGLRPEGKAGPLVRTLASHEAYYARWAKTWEFQALLKARPVAGDPELGAAYAEMAARMVWSAAGRPDFVADVQAMRRRVEATLPAAEVDRELKLGPGGLRDVEFAVQLLQLVHGRTDPSLHVGGTLPALAALSAGGYVGRDDAERLTTAYRFLRLLEHRLQLQQLRRTHLLPTAERELRWLARAAGFRGDAVAGLRTERARHARQVRRLHEKLFYRPLLSAVARLPAEASRLSPEAARARLAALGFADPGGALRHLEALTAGVSRRAAIQRTLLPVMLGWFADAADPDAGLLSFRQVSDALGGTHWYLRLLRDEGATAQRLARLLATSRYVADLFARAPEAVAMLANDAELVPSDPEGLRAGFAAAVARNDDAEAAVATVRGKRRQELLRIACGDLLGLIDLGVVGAALADVAGATLAAALEVATRTVAEQRGEELPVRMLVVAMGRFGGWEQGYGSDADVLFVHEPVGVPDNVAAQAGTEVANELRRLLAVPAPDPPLVVDADLRPEGRQGPLTRSLASYAAYYARWSAPWEAQALLRACPIAGDPDVGARFLATIDPIRYPLRGLEPAAVREIRRIKARVETERLPRGADPALHTKLGRGGLADVEWVVQLLQLRHAGQVPALRTTGTLPALAAATDAGLLARSDADVLMAAWRLASRVRNGTMLAAGRPSDAVPTTGRQLAVVARALGYPPTESARLLEDYRRLTRRARVVVERVFAS